MRSLIPVLSVILALIASGSIAYIAWDLTSERRPEEPDPTTDEESDTGPHDREQKQQWKDSSKCDRDFTELFCMFAAYHMHHFASQVIFT